MLLDYYVIQSLAFCFFKKQELLFTKCLLRAEHVGSHLVLPTSVLPVGRQSRWANSTAGLW